MEWIIKNPIFYLYLILFLLRPADFTFDETQILKPPEATLSIQTEKAEEFLRKRTYALFDIIVHFIIQKLKNKHTFVKNIQTEKAEKRLILTE